MTVQPHWHVYLTVPSYGNKGGGVAGVALHTRHTSKYAGRQYRGALHGKGGGLGKDAICTETRGRPVPLSAGRLLRASRSILEFIGNAPG